MECIDSTKACVSKPQAIIQGGLQQWFMTAQLDCRHDSSVGMVQGPPILKGVFGSLRGFAGQVSPAAALDAASNENALIIDIR